ncbi:hypothetical protein CONPUDRAFT_80388, partial [Coniophora puteana RWD-64-598 SS2]
MSIPYTVARFIQPVSLDSWEVEGEYITPMTRKPRSRGSTAAATKPATTGTPLQDV